METQLQNNASLLMLHDTVSKNNWNQTHSNDAEESAGVGILSDEFMEYSTKIIYVAMCGTFASFGILFNVVNILVFIKQGFADSVNISLFALAFSDLCILCAAVIQSLCYNIWINQLVTHVHFRHVQYIAGGWPRGFFTRISSFITAYISFERCLCIILPLKIKVIITRKVTLSVMAFIFTSILSGMIIVYSTIELTPQFSELLNKTVVSLAYKDGETSKELEAEYFLVLSLYQVTAFILVSVFTVTLVSKMKSKNKWREKTLTSSQMATMSTRDKKVMKMVVLISMTFIMCNIPTTSQLAAMYLVSKYGVNSVYRNMYIFIWSICTVSDVICASCNIFFYYTMSSKYAAIFKAMMPAIFKCTDTDIKKKEAE